MHALSVGLTPKPGALQHGLAITHAAPMASAMAIVALLFGPAEPPLTPLTVAGIEPIERQMRQVRCARATRVYILDNQQSYGDGSVNLDNPAMLGPRLSDADAVLVLAAGVVVDDRIIDAIITVAAAHSDGAAIVIATWPALGAPRGVERIDALTFAAGVAVYPALLVRRLAARLGHWDLHSALLRAALCEAGCQRIDLADLALNTAAGQQRSPLTYASVTSPESAAAATAMVFAATARRRFDAPGRYLYPPIEHVLLRWLGPTRMPPQALAVVVSVIALLGAAAFGYGWPWTGLALALLIGPLEAIPGRLVRARALRWPSPGWPIHTVVISYGWWLGLAAALVPVRGNGGPLAVAALILLAQLTTASEAQATPRFRGEDPGPADAIDSRVVLLAATRDSLTLLLVPFAFAGQWYLGLIALAVYSVASFAVTHARFIQRLQRQPSWRSTG